MFERYAIFYTPQAGDLARFGAAWLGWDSATGQAVAHPEVPGLSTAQIKALTDTPRKYGLHGTLKAPFELAETATQAALLEATAAFAARTAPVLLPRMALSAGRFTSLRPAEDSADLRAFASAVVRDLDAFRAPLSDAYLARRRKAGLSARQDQQMLDWGYPYIFEDFHFHLTLSGPVTADTGADLCTKLEPVLTPLVPAPFAVDGIAVMGEDKEGMFHQLQRFPLLG